MGTAIFCRIRNSFIFLVYHCVFGKLILIKMGGSDLEWLINGLISKIVVVIIEIILLLIIKRKIKYKTSFVLLYLMKIILDLYVVYTYVSRIQIVSNT